MSAVRCIECDRLKLRDNPKMAALGFGQCNALKPWQFNSVEFTRDCDRYKPADGTTVKGRLDWYEKRSKP